MNTNMTGFNSFQKSLCLCALDKSSLSIGKVKLVIEIKMRQKSLLLLSGNSIANKMVQEILKDISSGISRDYMPNKYISE